MKKQPAFTLIELMIAMAIVAILATAGIQAYTDYVKKGRDTARAQIAQNLNSSVMAYAASNGGNPPAGPDEFTQFLASAGETFGGGSIGGGGSGILLEDPVGGREVCLDAAGTPNQPCRFDYTAYADGTYAISYGVEHKSSTDENFYKTTDSVPEIDEDSTDINQQTAVEKYGVYIGSAKYIGQPSVTGITSDPNDGIDETTPGVTVAFRSLKMNEVVASGGGGPVLKANGESCMNDGECQGGLCFEACDIGCNDKICYTKPDNFCRISDDCNAGYSCEFDNGNGACCTGFKTCRLTSGRSTGEVCYDNAQCASLLCNGGVTNFCPGNWMSCSCD